MKEERIMILKMIESGKITADEGVSLLKAISKTSDTEEKLSKAAKQFKEKVSDFSKAAEPKVKKAAQMIKEKGGEMADEIGDRLRTGISRAKDTEECKGDIIEVDDDSYSFEYDEESEPDVSEDDDAQTDDEPTDGSAKSD